MVDPQIRLQNIALEHAELVARRSMSWSESTNRTGMFMTVLGAAVVGLALFAQTGLTTGSLALAALLIAAVVLFIGLTTFIRIVQLNAEDMRLIQGLNRLRHVRLELDPGLAPYLVTSPHDDFDSVIESYAPEGAPFDAGLATLAVLVLIVSSVLVAVVAGLVAINFGADAPTSLLIGLVAAFVFAIAAVFWAYRGIYRLRSSFKSLLPAASKAPKATPEPQNTLPARVPETPRPSAD